MYRPQHFALMWCRRRVFVVNVLNTLVGFHIMKELGLFDYAKKQLGIVNTDEELRDSVILIWGWA